MFILRKARSKGVHQDWVILLKFVRELSSKPSGAWRPGSLTIIACLSRFLVSIREVINCLKLPGSGQGNIINLRGLNQCLF